MAALLAGWLAGGPPAFGAPQPPAQAAYIWQRAWTSPVTNALLTLGTNFTELIALRAEVTWQAGQPQVAHVPVDYAALRGCGRPVGLALRIGSFSGPFAADDARALWLADLAAKLAREAATNGTTLAEFQLDFDCAESKLDGYAIWVKAIRERILPVPLTITALPSWLRQPACRRLVEAADGYVLQVHSLERPKDVKAAFTLCDPDAARADVETAARLGRPFKVALPTYGYLAAFDAAGRFAGLSAEGPAPNWQAGWTVREIRADASAMAGLVRSWSGQRPEKLTGIIWYRLPVATDRLNWRWPTLSKVMSGEVPQAEIRVAVRSPQPGLHEVEICNLGAGEFSGPLRVSVAWAAGRLVASDGFQGCELAEAGARQLEFKSRGRTVRLPPGECWRMGWLRLENGAEVAARLLE